MSLAGFPAARLQIEDTRFLISLFKRVSSTFNVLRNLLMCHRGNILIKIIQIFLFSLIALQPLHSYTVINTSSIPQDNGFHLLHAELCGSKYTNSISHTEKSLIFWIGLILLFCLICLKIVSVVIQLILIQQILLPSNITFYFFS